MICRASAENISIISKFSKLFRDDAAIFEVIQTEKRQTQKITRYLYYARYTHFYSSKLMARKNIKK